MALSQGSSRAGCLSRLSEQPCPPCSEGSCAAPHRDGLSPLSEALCWFLPGFMPAARPRFLRLSSPGVLSVQPVPRRCRGAARVVSCAPCSAWDFPAQRRVCCARHAGKPAPLCHASSVTHAVSGAVAFGCRAAGRDCSAELPQCCQAAANPTQAESASLISERKKTSVLGSPPAAGLPAAQCLTCWGSPHRLCRSALAPSVGMAVVRDGSAGRPGRRAVTGDIPLSPGVPAASAQSFPLRLQEPRGRHHPLVPSSSLGLPALRQHG